MSSASTTRLLVLGVVRILQPVHGYDARRELLSWRADEWASVAPGSVYHQLKTLVADGLLTVVATQSEAERPARTVYTVTADGDAEFTRLLRESWSTLGASPASILAATCFLPHLPRTELLAALAPARPARRGPRRAAGRGRRAPLAQHARPCRRGAAAVCRAPGRGAGVGRAADPSAGGRPLPAARGVRQHGRADGSEK